MLDVNPADVSDELDAVYADRVKRIKFHTSVKTIFGQTRSRSPDVTLLVETKSSAMFQRSCGSTF